MTHLANARCLRQTRTSEQALLWADPQLQF